MKCASIAAALLAGSLFGAPPLLAEKVADTIYFGGPILTINDAQPTAEAVAVKGGRILAVGSRAAINSYRGKATVDFNLAGRAMLPGFVDSRGHVAIGGLQAYSANLLAPPDGPVSSIAALQAALRDWAEANANIVDRKHIIFGFGYDNFLREDQVDSFQKLVVFPSLFPMHTYYWGDWHRDHTVGPVNAENISPTGWLVKRHMMFGTHHDAPVAFPDSMRVLAATVTRRTRSGKILGPDQRVDVKTALKAMTIWPAWQHFEEDTKGSIEVGKLADFAILSQDPTVVDPETLADIKVIFAIKEGAVAYDASKKRGPAWTSSLPFLGDPEFSHLVIHDRYKSMD